MRTVLFYRDFRKFHGGHLKVWHYFNHVRASSEFEPRINFTTRSTWGEANPWQAATDALVDSPARVDPDVFFLGGRDWLRMDRHPAASRGVPVINYLAHVRHADPASNRFEFLRRRAIRVCMSEPVAEAVEGTGVAQGPIFVAPTAIDIEGLAPAGAGRHRVDVLVAALKNPGLGRAIGRRLQHAGRRVEVLTELLPRDTYLDKVRHAYATVFLPNESEGFYLPSLEGMALRTLVICPAYVGEPAHYEPWRNCIRCEYSEEEIVRSAELALALPPQEAEAMRRRARTTAEAHTLDRERKFFLGVLHAVDRLWSETRSREG